MNAHQIKSSIKSAVHLNFDLSCSRVPQRNVLHCLLFLVSLLSPCSWRRYNAKDAQIVCTGIRVVRVGSNLKIFVFALRECSSSGAISCLSSASETCAQLLWPSNRQDSNRSSESGSHALYLLVIFPSSLLLHNVVFAVLRKRLCLRRDFHFRQLAEDFRQQLLIRILLPPRSASAPLLPLDSALCCLSQV